MRHNSVVITASDLYDRLSETDDILDSVEWIGAGAVFEKDGGFNKSSRKTWYVVTWPEHVTVPRYNSDCSCSGPWPSRDEAIAEASGQVKVYGE